MARAYASVEQFLSAQDEFEFACLVLDVHLPGLSGRQLQDKLAHRQCRPSIVFVSANADVGTSVEAIKAGAIDFLEKPVDAEILLAAVEKAFERYEANRKQVQSLSQWKERMTKLSVRERQIMEHVVQGRLNKQIAADLLIAEQTVKQHRGRVMEKLGVRSLAELVRAFEAARMDKASGASHQIWKTSPAEETPILTSRRSRN